MGRSTVGGSAFGGAFNADKVFSHLLGSAIGDLLTHRAIGLPCSLGSWIFDTIHGNTSVVGLIEGLKPRDFCLEHRDAHGFNLVCHLERKPVALMTPLRRVAGFIAVEEKSRCQFVQVSGNINSSRGLAHSALARSYGDDHVGIPS